MAIRTAVGGPVKKLRRVLVVDDEPHIVRLMQVALTRVGCEVACAYDGLEALQKVGESTFDAMVLDLLMPKLDGFGVLRQVRANPATENLFVFLVTSKAQDSDIFEGYRQGADMYLTKPFNLSELTGMFGG